MIIQTTFFFFQLLLNRQQRFNPETRAFLRDHFNIAAKKVKKKKEKYNAKIHFFESFRSEPVKQVSYRPRCSTSGYACSCVCVGHSGDPRDLHTFEFEFIIFKDSPTGKNPDRGGLHREVVRK